MHEEVNNGEEKTKDANELAAEERLADQPIVLMQRSLKSF